MILLRSFCPSGATHGSRVQSGRISGDGNCAIGHGLRGVAKVPLVLGSVEQFIGAICAATRGVPTEPRRLAFLSIATGMTVAPIPVLILLLGVQLVGIHESPGDCCPAYWR